MRMRSTFFSTGENITTKGTKDTKKRGGRWDGCSGGLGGGGDARFVQVVLLGLGGLVVAAAEDEDAAGEVPEDLHHADGHSEGEGLADGASLPAEEEDGEIFHDARALWGDRDAADQNDHGDGDEIV